MGDLNARIQAKLAEFESSAEYGNEGVLGMVIRVTRNVLDRHRPEPFATYLGDDPPLYCLECAHAYSQEAWPCDTVKDIVNALGIEL